MTGRTALAKVESSTVLIDRGTVTGSPIGSGSHHARLHPPPQSGHRVHDVHDRERAGHRHGPRHLELRRHPAHITFTGAGALTGGTARLRRHPRRPLAFDAVHSVTGKREAIALTGRATIP